MVNAALNPALMAAAQKAALSSKAIVDQLTNARALDPRKATALDLSADGASDALAYLVKRGQVRDAGGGRYWLDRDAMERSKANSVRWLLIIAVFLVSLGVSLAAILATR